MVAISSQPSEFHQEESLQGDCWSIFWLVLMIVISILSCPGEDYIYRILRLLWYVSTSRSCQRTLTSPKWLSLLVTVISCGGTKLKSIHVVSRFSWKAIFIVSLCSKWWHFA
jgi:hypothetical protein